MIYIKNTNTNEIEQLSQIPSEYYGSEKETFTNKNGITCERLKLKDEYVILNESDLEVQEILLEKIKLNQINSIKKKRDENLSSDHFSTNAFILKETGFFQFDFVFDDDGKKVEKKFIFSLNTGGSPINHPKAIIDRVQFKSLKDPNYFLRYSCRFEDGTKGYVALDAIVAESISNHLKIEERIMFI